MEEGSAESGRGRETIVGSDKETVEMEGEGPDGEQSCSKSAGACGDMSEGELAIVGKI